MKTTALIIPTFNGGQRFLEVLASLRAQTFLPDDCLIVDSGSEDRTPEAAAALGFRLHSISRSEFNHGGTRRMAAEMCPRAEILIYMTQDAVLAETTSLANLMACFNDAAIGMAYGRQLPRPGVGPVESFDRLFNYGAKNLLKSYEDRTSLGIKTVFVSNSYAAYRREALISAGGFPSNLILGEDTYIATKMLLQGWKIFYAAGATVYHSHYYSIRTDFRRYFDTGVLHAVNPWIHSNFGVAENEGKKFVVAQVKYILHNQPLLLPSVIIRDTIRWLGFKIGRHEALIPLWLKKRLSMDRLYWDKWQNNRL